MLPYMSDVRARLDALDAKHAERERKRRPVGWVVALVWLALVLSAIVSGLWLG